jgi:hypothetical protein
MKIASALLAFCLVTLCLAPAQARERRPVVVELFTSQGCGACTRANALMADLAERTDVLALTFPVDYWDYLGWRDTFAKPEFSARQRAYLKDSREREAYTPQVVVDGGGQPPAEDLASAIQSAARAKPLGPALRIAHGRLIVGPGQVPAGGAEVWLVRYELQPRETAVTDGENRGVTVVYRNVATDLRRLGLWTGRPCAYPLPRRDEDARTAILVQARATGRILAVLKA